MFFFPQINVYKIYKMSSEYSFINELFSIMFTNYYVPTKLRLYDLTQVKTLVRFYIY